MTKPKFCKKCGCDTERNKVGRCKPCLKAYGIAFRLANPGKNAATCRKNYEANWDKRKAYRGENAELLAANHARWVSENKDHVREYARKHRAENPEKVKATALRAYAKHSGRIKATNAAYKLKNADRVVEWGAAWRARNVDRIKVGIQAWLEANPEARRTYARNRRAREKNAKGHFSPSDVQAMMLNQKGRCVYCQTGITENYHIDHIHPLAKGGSNWPINLQLLCPPCNLSKSDLDEAEFLRRKGYDLI